MSERSVYKTAVVTGATSGIGRATVLKLREMGLEVYAVGNGSTVPVISVAL